MKLKEYLEQVKEREKAATSGPYFYQICRFNEAMPNWKNDEQFYISARQDIPKLLSLVEIMSGALKELNRRQFAGCGTCPSGLQEHQQIAQDARVECERILSE